MKYPPRNLRRLTISIPAKIVIAALCCAGSISALGAPYTWMGSGSDILWSNSANWGTGGAAVSATDSAVVMNGQGNVSSKVDGASPFKLQSITFDNTAGVHQLSGNTIYIYGTNADLAPGITNNSSQTQTFSNALIFLASRARAVNGDIIFNGATLGSYNVTGATAPGVRFWAGNEKSIVVNSVITSDNQYSTVGINGEGAGNIYFNAVNTYTANTSIFNNNLIISKDALVGVNGALGNSTTVVNLGSAGGKAGLLTAAAVEVGRDLRANSGSTKVIIGGNTAHVSTFSGIISLGNDNGAAQGVNITAATGGRVNITGTLARATGAIGSGDTVTKVGSGIVSISGTMNSYSGTTTVSEGALLINGTLGSGGAAVNVSSGATLGGIGTISRSVNIANGGILSPGDMDAGGASLGGNLTINQLFLNDLSVVQFNLASPVASGNDHVSILGDLTLDGILNINPAAGFANGSYELFSYTGGLTNNGLTLGSLPIGFSYSIDTSVQGIVNLVVVPEPQTLGLLLSACTVGLAVHSQRNRQRRGQCSPASNCA